MMGYSLPANLRSRVRTNMPPGDVLHPIATRQPRVKKERVVTPAELEWNREMEKLPGVFIPMRIVSLINRRGKLGQDMARHKAQRTAAYVMVREWFGGGKPELPVRVTLIRYGVRTMDSDNCVIAFKHVRDGVADALGVDDADERIEWVYAEQVRSKFYGIRLLIESVKP